MKRYAITSVEPVRFPVLRLVFEDGLIGEIDLAKDISRGEMLTPLRDPEYFRQVALGEGGRSFGWNLDVPGEEIDFCVDAARIDIESRLVAELTQGHRPPPRSGSVQDRGRGARRSPDATFQVFRDVAGTWRWRLITSSGKQVTCSTSGYPSKQGCLDEIELIKSARVRSHADPVSETRS